MTNVAPFRDKSHDSQIDFDIPAENWKKNPVKRGSSALSRVVLILLRILLTRVIVARRKSMSATNLTESSSSTGVRAPRWQLEEREHKWMTGRDLGWHMHMTPVKHIPFLSPSLSLSLSVDPCLLCIRLICIPNRRSLRETFGVSANVSKI